ncbi:MAG TPA: hypothetical protein VIN38_07725 [Thiobacillus sp.]
MSYLFVVATIAFIAVCIVVFLVVSRFRRLRTSSIQFECERALERDAIRLASAKLKFRNILAKQGQRISVDPLRDLYGVDVPTDCQLN